ncbi:chloride channel protein [candidate division WOR-3 bacterium]|nr:chloride channel protein [candidate division WOR-3 bacterium]
MKKVFVGIKLFNRKLTGRKWESRTSKYVGMNIMAAFTGILCGVTAVCFRFLIQFFQFIFLDKGVNSFKLFYPYHIILIPGVGALLSGLIVYIFAKEAKGHGIPQVMEAFEVLGGRIRKRIVAVKAISSAVAIGSGGSAGREGPIVQMGAGIGSAFSQLLKLNVYQTRILLACGVSGAISATFDTPVGGVLFAIELIIREFKTVSFVPIVIASVFAGLTSKIFLSLIGRKPELIFALPPYDIVSSWEFAFYIILGVISGGVSYLYVKSIYFSEGLFEKMKFSEWAKPAIGGLLTGLTGVMLIMRTGHPLVFGNGYDAIGLLMSAELSFSVIALMIFLKIAATSFTIGSGGSGGVFAPSLVIGAMTGGAFGMIVSGFFPSLTAGFQAYAIVGMAAVFAGMSRATLTAIIMVFEMTGNYNIIMPLMLSCVISDILAVVTLKGSIYTIKLKRRGINIEHDMEINVLDTVKAGEIIERQSAVFSENDTMEYAVSLVANTSQRIFPILRENVVKGVVSEHEILSCKDRRQKYVKDIMRSDFVQVFSDQTLEEILTKYSSEDTSAYVVVEEEKKLFLGLITPEEILQIYGEKKRALLKKI